MNFSLVDDIKVKWLKADLYHGKRRKHQTRREINPRAAKPTGGQQGNNNHDMKLDPLSMGFHPVACARYYARLSCSLDAMIDAHC